jgi:hypothetical protein
VPLEDYIITFIKELVCFCVNFRLRELEGEQDEDGGEGVSNVAVSEWPRFLKEMEGLNFKE